MAQGWVMWRDFFFCTWEENIKLKFPFPGNLETSAFVTAPSQHKYIAHINISPLEGTFVLRCGCGCSMLLMSLPHQAALTEQVSALCKVCAIPYLFTPCTLT